MLDKTAGARRVARILTSISKKRAAGAPVSEGLQAADVHARKKFLRRVGTFNKKQKVALPLHKVESAVDRTNSVVGEGAKALYRKDAKVVARTF